MLDNENLFQDIINTLKEFTFSIEENELFGDANFRFEGLSAE